MSEDPARAGSNWYSYVGSNPINRFDPTGLREAIGAHEAGGDTKDEKEDLSRYYTDKANSNSSSKSAGPILPVPSPQVQADLLLLMRYGYERSKYFPKDQAKFGLIDTWEDADDLAESLELELTNELSGLESHLYRNKATGQLAYVITGTNEPLKEHLGTNFQQYEGRKTKQYSAGIENAKALRDSRRDVVLAGDSMGGGIASAGSMVSGLFAVTYNASEVNPETVKAYGFNYTDRNILAIVNQGEILSEFLNQKAAGTKVVLTNPPLPGIVPFQMGTANINLPTPWFAVALEESLRRHQDFGGSSKRILEGKL